MNKNNEKNKNAKSQIVDLRIFVFFICMIKLHFDYTESLKNDIIKIFLINKLYILEKKKIP